VVRADGPFDLMFVDGPARLPADRSELTLFALFDALSAAALLLMEGGNRPGDREAVECWRARSEDAISVDFVNLKERLWLV
jgi:hypothetical protein